MHPRPPSILALSLLGATLLSSFAFAQATLNTQGPAPKPTVAPNPPANPDAAGKPADAKATDENKAMVSYKAFFDAKLAGLQAGLQLTAAQVALWPPVETAIRDLAKTHFAIHHPSQGEPMDAREQLQRTADQLIRSGQAMKTLTDATGPLLAALDPDQKERLPQLLQGLPPHGILQEAFDATPKRDGDHTMAERRHSRMNEEGRGDDERRAQEEDRGGDQGRESRYDHERDHRDQNFRRRHRDDDEAYDHHQADRHRGDKDEDEL